jgi:hypothetical protein
MERTPHGPDAAPPPPGVGSHIIWLILLAALTGWQVWLTLGLFGPDRPWERMLGPDPIVSGRHPLHLYHGWLGARSFLEHGCPCCYDPSFQWG